MTRLDVFTAMPKRGVLRPVVLALTLVGFAALHAFGPAAGDGTHCGSAPALMMTAAPHSTAPHSTGDSPPPDHHHALAVADHDEGARAGATTPGHHSEHATMSCLLALFGALVLIGLRLLRRFGTDTTAPHLRSASTSLHAARGPPAPLFLSLCVFRL